MIFDLVFGLVGTIIGVALGSWILFAGRHAIHITLGIIGLSATANFFANFVLDLDNGWDLINSQQWLFMGIALVIGVIGFLFGRAKPQVAKQVIGFAAGADITLWFYDISTHIMTNVAQLSETAAIVVGLVLFFIGGMLGLWLVRTVEDEALILITMIVGAQMIQAALGLNRTSGLTAILVLTLALAGLLVQYALYLREIKSEQLEIEPQPSSVAYFQDLELH